MQVIVFMKPGSGNDANDGQSWATPKKTYLACEALLSGGSGTVIICLGGNGIEPVAENIIPADYKRGILIGDAKDQYSYWITGANDANPMVSLIGSEKHFKLCNVTLLALDGLGLTPIPNKPYIVLDGAGSPVSLGATIEFDGEVSLAITEDGQIGIRLDEFMFGKPIQGVRFLTAIGASYSGSHYIQCNKTTTPVTPILVRNCIFVFADTGIPGIEEPDIYNVSAGAIDCCKFYNCAWVKVDALGHYTLMTARNTYPSGADAANRDPEPNQAIDWNLILPQLKLAVRDVEDGTKVAAAGAADRTNTEIYNAIAAPGASLRVEIRLEEKLIRPSAGSKIYRIFVNLYDNVGSPLAPDSDPTIKITTRDELTVRVAETPMSGVSVGQYYYDYTISSATPIELETIIVKVVENAVTSYHRDPQEIYEEGSSGSGSGSVIIDQDYGGIDNYQILRIGTGAPIEGTNLYMFTQTDWNAGNRDLRSVHDGGNCRGQSTTGSDGRWLTPIALDPDTYIMFVSDPLGEYIDSPITIIVT